MACPPIKISRVVHLDCFFKIESNRLLQYRVCCSLVRPLIPLDMKKAFDTLKIESLF